MENARIRKDIDTFNNQLATETDFKKFLALIRQIASRFSFLEEEDTVYSYHTIILGLVEQYKNELI